MILKERYKNIIHWMLIIFMWLMAFIIGMVLMFGAWQLVAPQKWRF